MIIFQDTLKQEFSMIRLVASILVILSISLSVLYAETPLPCGLAQQEIGLPLPQTDDPTHPPDEPVRTIAEWEENEAIFVRWGEHNALLSAIIDKVVDVTKAYVVVSSNSQASSCLSYLTGQGVLPLDSVFFFVQPTNSVWIRDYAPWWFWRLESWDRGMYEWDYNRPRPLDDVIPEWLSQLWGIEYYGMDLTHTGGNWLIDGQGNAYCSQLILIENWGLTAADVNEMFYQYASLDSVVLTPTFFGIDHLNMSAKLLNDHTVLVNEYPPGSPHTAAMDQTVEIFRNMTNQYGQPFKVIRIPTPEWYSTPYTYCNSLIVQNRVLVPTYNIHPNDEDALAIYTENMPGYEIYGINSNSTIGLSGAINCITSNVPHPSLIHITSAPLPNTLNTTDPYQVSAEIVSLGNLNPDSLLFYWRSTDSPEWSSDLLVNTGGDTYEGYIPACTGGYVDYFIFARNIEGNWTTLPRYGPEAHNTFHTGPFPLSLDLDPVTQPIVIPPEGGSFNYNFTVNNTGTYPITGDIWIDIIVPNGGTLPITLRENVSIGENSSLFRQLIQVVPASAPEGSYTCYAAIGEYPNEVFTDDSFTFVKEEGNVGLIPEDGWASGGWDSKAPSPSRTKIPNDSSIILSSYPNPFNPTTTISYQLSTVSFVNLSVYDVSGRLVSELVNDRQDAGVHEVRFDGSEFASGVYIFRIKTGNFTVSKKIMLIK